MNDADKNAKALCLCGSGKRADRCCLPIIAGEQPASSVEALMRSRYVAYVLKNSSYLQSSWHSSTRPESLSLEDEDGPVWTGLEVLDSGASGDEGYVEFKASFMQPVESRRDTAFPANAGILHEKSRFIKEQGQWKYVDGELFEAEPVPLKMPGRNEPCFCGSGKKFKKCCGKNP